MAAGFSDATAEYAADVYKAHRSAVDEHVGRPVFRRILEVGPGTAIGVSILFTADAVAAGARPPEVVLWDRYANVDFNESLIRKTAGALAVLGATADTRCALSDISKGRLKASIDYVIGGSRALAGRTGFDFVYSHAALEHIWEIAAVWRVLAECTAEAGVHSHQIDLRDHGRPDANYLEMCQYGRLTYWLTQRFVPGAINRWRASDHLTAAASGGIELVHVSRTMAKTLPLPREALARGFRTHSLEDLLTTGVYFVGRKLGEPMPASRAKASR